MSGVPPSLEQGAIQQGQPFMMQPALFQGAYGMQMPPIPGVQGVPGGYVQGVPGGYMYGYPQSPGVQVSPLLLPGPPCFF